MNESKEKILQMLQDGSITPEEADRLLLAVGNTEWEDTDGGGESEESPVPEISTDDVLLSDAPPAELPPDFEGLRDSWQTPFNVALALVATFFVLSMALMRSTRGVLNFGAKLLLSACVICGFGGSLYLVQSGWAVGPRTCAGLRW